MLESVSVIIAAAGSSSRTGGIKKQFMEIEGIPIIVRSVRKFQTLRQVREIIIVTAKQDVGLVKGLCQGFQLEKVKEIVEGGNTRQQSVFNGFEHCDGSCDLLAVHDAARPFVRTEDIERVFKAATRSGAALLGVPVKDTIKIVQNGIVKDTPERPSLYQAQTPQVFSMELYGKWIAEALRMGLDFTDDCQLAEASGAVVAMVDGSYENIKITTPEDIIIAKHWAREEAK